MKNKNSTLTAKKVGLIILFCCFLNLVKAECSFISSDGYTVKIAIAPISLVINNSSCNSNGFEYQIKYSYNISFTTPPPVNKGLYTLQGVFNCGTVSINLPLGGGSGTVVSDNHAYYSTGAPSCNSATPANIGCSSISIHIYAPGIPDQIVNCPFSTVLPVTYLSFNATIFNNNVKLTWNTATETNNNFFTIEKSLDNQNWTAIGKITGASNATQLNNYTFDDNYPSLNIAYYRIKQTDNDGNFSYSPIVSINFQSSTKLGIFPNPNSSNNININGIQSSTGWQLKLMNTASQVIFATTISSNQLALPQLPAGVYLIKLSNTSTGISNVFKYFKM